MDVSIIIVNYNTRKLTAECLASVFDKTRGVEFEAVVVDNDSRDGSPEQFAADSRITFIPSGGNIGFGRANNRGIEVATGRNILFLNPDTLLLNNAIKILSDFLDEHPRAGACGGNLYQSDHGPNLSFFRLFPATGDWNFIFSSVYSRLFFRNNGFFNHTGKPLPVAFVSGADMMVKHAVLKEIGRFDEDFFMYFEEAELSWRIRRKGYGIYSVPAAKIMHLGKQSQGDNDFFFTHFFESRRIFLSKIYPPWQIQLLNRTLLLRHRFQIATGRAKGQARDWSLNCIHQLQKNARPPP
jgi:GT2 family glycosyltransferase